MSAMRMYYNWSRWYYEAKRHHPEMPLYIEIMPEERMVRAFDESRYPQGLQIGESGIRIAELARASIADWKAALEELKEFAKQARKENLWEIIALVDGDEL